MFVNHSGGWQREGEGLMAASEMERGWVTNATDAVIYESILQGVKQHQSPAARGLDYTSHINWQIVLCASQWLPAAVTQKKSRKQRAKRTMFIAVNDSSYSTRPHKNQDWLNSIFSPSNVFQCVSINSSIYLSGLRIFYTFISLFTEAVQSYF